MSTKTKRRSSKKKLTLPEVEPDPVMDGFRFELKKLLDDDFTPKTLNLIIQIASAARDILTLRNPRLGCRQPGLLNGGGVYSNYGSVGSYSPPVVPMNDEDSGDAQTPSSNPPSDPWMDRETFGSKILREFITALPQLARASREDPSQLVKALSVAREAGMDDIAAELEDRLRGNYLTSPITTEAKAR